jgi:hypothetical protein
MSYKDQYKQHLLAKFKPFIARAGGGVFTRKTRERLLGVRVTSGRDRTKNDFWYDVRNKVRNALVDLNLFIQTADKEQVSQVITKETLEPVVLAVLYNFYCTDPDPDPNKAEIANMIIQRGFDYFKEKANKSITLSHERSINEAVDLSNYLCKTINENSSSRPKLEHS